MNFIGHLMPGDCWSDGIRSCALMFFLTVWFHRERGEALLSVFIMGHVLRFMLMSEGGEWHGSRVSEDEQRWFDSLC
jgi:hypothetical protein